MVSTEERTDKSAQSAEVVVAMLAARQSLQEKQNILHLFTDSWCIANGIDRWSGKWKANDWKINAKDRWFTEF